MNAHSGWLRWRDSNASVYTPPPVEDGEPIEIQQVQYNSGVGFENAYKAGWTDGYTEGYEAGQLAGASDVADRIGKKLTDIVEGAMLR